MNGENPGVYERLGQTEWWPFLPALGVLVGVCLVVVFLFTTAMAVRREGPALWAAACGLIAALILGFSVLGCVAAATQYEEREARHHDLYVAQVAEWVGDEIGGEVTVGDAVLLLDGESITAAIGGKQTVVSLEQDRRTDTLSVHIH